MKMSKPTSGSPSAAMRTDATGANEARSVVAGPMPLRVSALAESLMDAMRPIVTQVTGSSARPSTLARTLSIDPSLSARVLRALRSDDVADVIHEIPSPEGLRIILAAATRHGIDPAARDTAARAIREFEVLLDEIPGGRATLDSIASEWSPATRERAEHSARQGIYKSMSSLLGFFAETSMQTVIVQPSESAGFCDAVYVLGKYGLRRMRNGGRITVYGRQGGLNPSDGDVEDTTKPSSRSLTLSGVWSQDPREYLLSEFCSRPVPELQVARQGNVDLCLLPERVPDVNQPTSIVSAQLLRRSGVRPASASQEPYWEAHLPRVPSKFLLFDILVREDTFSGTPSLTSTLHGLSTTNVLPDSPTFPLDEVAMGTPMQHLARGLSGLEVTELPQHANLVDSVFRRVGWDRGRFVGYRCRVRYPVPMVKITYWFRGTETKGAAP